MPKKKKKHLWNVNKYKNAYIKQNTKKAKLGKREHVHPLTNPDLGSYDRARTSVTKIRLRMKWDLLAPRHLSRYSCTTT